MEVVNRSIRESSTTITPRRKSSFILACIRQAPLFLLLVTLYGGYPLSTHAASMSLVVSEVMYDPTGSEPGEEWIEIYNLGTSLLDLTSFKIGDEETASGSEGMMQFPSGTMIAGGTMVIANQATAFFAVYGFNPAYELVDTDSTVPDMVKYTAWSNGNILLTNSGDEVLILDGIDQIVDTVSWGSSLFAFDPSAPDVIAGHSLAREFANIDTDTASDWQDRVTPNPGQVATNVNAVPLPPAVWLFLSGIFGMVGLARRKIFHKS